MRIHLALLTVSLCFGMHYFWGKVVVHALPDPAWPVAWAAIRSAATAAVLWAAAIATGRWRLPGRDLPRIAALALFGVVVNQLLFVTGLRLTTPTQSSLVNTAIPVMTLALACLFRQERMTWRKAAGLALALSGVGLLLVPKAAGETLHGRGNAITFANALSFTCFLVLSRPVMARWDALAATAWLFTFGAAGIAIAAAPVLPRMPLGQVAPKAWLYGGLIVTAGTALTFFLNNWALRQGAPASTVAAYIYLQPLVAAGCSVAWLGERISPDVLAAAALIFAGVALGVRGGGSRKWASS